MASASSSGQQGQDESAMTPAQRLRAQHTAVQSHQPTVEEVPDEDDLKHPPPSTRFKPEEPPNAETMSAKAAGKQKATTGSTGVGNGKPKSSAALNPTSEVDFPTLAARPSANPSAATWGNRPAAVSQGFVNGSPQPGSNVSSRPSTPGQSSNYEPTGKAAPTNRRPMKLPGFEFSDSITLSPSQIRSPSDMKKTVKQILDESNRKWKTKVTSRTGTNGQRVFEAQGPSHESVRDVLKSVVAEVGAKQSIKVPIPASTRGHVVGKGGATIKGITQRSGAKIHMPPNQPATSDPNNDDDDTMIHVEIEGNAVTAALAEREIRNIVGERTASVNTRLKNIPPEFFPHLAGAHNARIRALEDGRDVRISMPEYETWQHPPPISDNGNGLLTLSPREGYHIHLSGDRAAANQVQEELEREVSRLRRDLALEQLEIERPRHKFILGERGGSLHDFLEETGCSIIMPPDSEDTEVLTVIGPPDQLESAKNKAYDLASSMQVQHVDIAKQHATSTSHSSDLTRYLQQRLALQQFEEAHDAFVDIPSGLQESGKWRVWSRDGKRAMKARSEITNLVGAHPPARFRNLDIHPYHQHQLKSQARLIRDEYGVHALFAEPNAEEAPLLLVFEGTDEAGGYQFPCSKPTPTEIAQFKQALNEAADHIYSQPGIRDPVLAGNVETPKRFHEKVKRYVHRQGSQNRTPVQFLSIKPKAGADHLDVAFRGRSEDVANFEKDLLDFIAEQVNDETQRDYVTSCDLPQKYASQLIGKGGEKINQIRDDYDVEIQLHDGKVEIKGPPAKAGDAKRHIMNKIKTLEDTIDITIRVPAQFHGDLIGPKGSNTNKLQNRYKVGVKFPRAASTPDDQMIANGGSEPGGADHRRRSAQNPDEIIIHGSKKGVEDAKKELMDLYEYVSERSHTENVSVARDQVSRLVGIGGREVNKIREQTKARIHVPRLEDDADALGKAIIEIRGRKSEVEEARRLLEARSKEMDESIVRSLDVDLKHFPAIVGRNGENLHQMIIDAGGSGDASERARLIKVPKTDAPPDQRAIRLDGNKVVVDNLANAIEALVDRREKSITQTLNVPRNQYRTLVGTGGSERKKLEKEFGVSLNVPRESDSQASGVTLNGLPEDVGKAAERIQSMLRKQEGETVDVPAYLHALLAEPGDGNLAKSLRRELRVTTDYPKQSAPRSDTLRPIANGATTSSLPLITDDTHVSEGADVNIQHSWDVAAPSAKDEDGSTISWVLKGEPDNVAKAKERVLEAIKDAEETHIGNLGLADSGMYGLIIGPQGSTINRIRKQTGCKIDVPQQGSTGGAVVIRGGKEGIEQAKEMILETVNAGPRRRR
ncbi:MAG: hypothetical protein M1831_001397 [Alyxoria varia]|nr:MAG: hypothetical protein M1831_001397 [Alyxoria varia]